MKPATKPCECGKLMILRHTGHRSTMLFDGRGPFPNYVLLREWRCFGCDHAEIATGVSIYSPKDQEAKDREAWEWANKEQA